jgi:hypothetical protein
VSAYPTQVGYGRFVPALDLMIVGGLVEELKADNVWDGREEGGEEAQGESRGVEVGTAGE